MRQTEWPLTVTLGFVSTAFIGFLGSYSLCMYTLLNLDVVGRSLNLPQGRVPCPFLGLEKVGVCVEGVGGGEGVGIWIGIF